MASVPPATSMAAELNRLGTGGRDDRLHFRLVLGILLRCLPLLRGVRRHLAVFAGVVLTLFLVLLPPTAILMDVLWTGVLQGNALTDVQAWLLGVDPSQTVAVDALSSEARRMIRDQLLVGTLLVLVLVVLPASGGLFYYYIWITQRINQELRMQLMDRLQQLSLRFHADTRIGDAVYRLHQDSAMVSDLIEALFLTPLIHIGRYGVAIAGVSVFDPFLGALFALVWLPGLAMGYWFSRRLRTGFRAARESNAALTSRIQEILAGIKVIKAYGREPQEHQSFESHSRLAFAAAFRVRWLVCLFSVLTFILVALPVLVGTARTLEMTRTGAPVFAVILLGFFGFERFTLGAFNFFKAQASGGSGSFRMMFRMWARLQDMSIGLDRVFELLDLEPEVQDAPDAMDLPPLREGVAFRDVHFAYEPGRDILRGVSLEAPVGSITALVGPTGSGKSTLVNLLVRLFDPDRGSVEIDGRDLRAVRLASLRGEVSIALQENLLFGATVRENIRYAVPEASEQQVRAAAEVACANDFIEALPEGYDTVLGERGTKLSTGQRQRLSIARAVIKDPRILILDEPTAALDAETELRVLQNLAEWGRGRVIVLITHRLSSIRRADQIAVLSDGALVECGSEAELLAREGPYSRMIHQETRAAEEGMR